MRKQDGFTLIEIAVVLVIIGLLVGGVLKGQELITNARVRHLILQQDGVRAAYFGFLDRYRALPGDYNQAAANIAGIAAGACTGNGDGNGRIETAGSATPGEHILAWEHLSKAGFINGSYTCVAAGAETPSSTPTNAYAARLQLVWDAVYDPAASAARHNLKTGSQIPSDILAEVDRKIDDGRATGGTIRFSAYDGGEGGGAPKGKGKGGGGGAGGPAGSGSCYLGTAGNPWNSQTPEANCGATTLFY